MAGNTVGQILVRMQHSISDCKEAPLDDGPARGNQFSLFLSPGGDAPKTIEFSTDAFIPRLLRGRRLRCGDRLPKDSLTRQGVVLATASGRPVWVTIGDQGARRDVVLQGEDWYAEEDRVFEHLKGDRLFRCIPILEWLRHTANWDKWRKPPTMACIMFDDPNLHSTRYGFISFGELLQAAKSENFSVALATVPLDGWYVNKKAVRLIGESNGRISLLLHGLHHSRKELSRDGETLLPLRAPRALRRIERIEEKFGLKFSRVMAPPHGAFSIGSMGCLASLGIEAACVSWGSIWSSNRDDAWTRLLGAHPGLLISGLGILPRFRLAEGIENQLLLSAYLNQPIIPVGHHWDVAEGLDLLKEVASFVNGLGDVLWCDTGTMARKNYLVKENGKALHVRPLSRVVDLHVEDDGLEEVIVELENWPYCDDDSGLEVAIRQGSRRLKCEKNSSHEWVLWQPRKGDYTIEIKPQVEGVVDPSEAEVPFSHLARRIASETRDRVMPFLPRRLWKRWAR